MDLTGLGSVADFASGIMDRFWPPKMTEEQKTQASAGLAEAIGKRDAARDAMKAEVMKAELSQGDTFTKRARPSIVYFGLLAIGLVHVIMPIAAWSVLMSTGKPLADMPQITLPSQFWATWGGVCSIWIIGRSAERFGSASKIVGAITGSK